MKSPIAFLVFLVTSALTLTSSTGNVSLLKASCSAICNSQCQAADGTCRMVPGVADICLKNKVGCSKACGLACACLDGCLERCKVKDACKDDGDSSQKVSFLCNLVALPCTIGCPISCGFRTGSSIATDILAAITAEVAQGNTTTTEQTT